MSDAETTPFVRRRMDGKVAVITGGGNGIGRATAVRFAEEGASVVVADIQADSAAETVEMVEAAGSRGVSLSVDVTSPEANAEMAALAVETFGGIDAVMTAAGVTHANYVSGDVEADIKNLVQTRVDYADRPGWEFVDADPDEWDKVLAINLKGTLLSMQACVAHMLELGRGGTVVTIASIAAKHPDAGPLAYTTSKAGVWMLTKKSARMLAPAGIRVNAIGPGFIDTNMTAIIDHIPRGENDPDFFDQVPMGRRGLPLEVANTALFLSNDESSYFTGAILHPDGGYFTD
jgi:NAD(P)-dependent dehydrogenase (short-subunit alcohol dehydrogenase family)